MANETGAVEFRGDRNTICGEAAGYTVSDENGNEVEVFDLLQPGYTVSGIPEDNLLNWLANPKFKAADPVAERAADTLANEQARRINGQEVKDQQEAEEQAEQVQEETAAQRRARLKAEEQAEQQRQENSGQTGGEGEGN